MFIKSLAIYKFLVVSTKAKMKCRKTIFLYNRKENETCIVNKSSATTSGKSFHCIWGRKFMENYRKSIKRTYMFMLGGFDCGCHYAAQSSVSYLNRKISIHDCTYNVAFNCAINAPKLLFIVIPEWNENSRELFPAFAKCIRVD